MNAPLPHNLLQFGTPTRSLQLRLGGLVRSNRFTLGGALLFAWAMPVLAGGWLERTFGTFSTPRDITQGAIVAMIALVASHVVLGKIGMLPLVDDKILVLPSVVSSYATTVSLCAFALGPYAYLEVAASFGAAFLWFLSIAMLRARLTFPRLAYVGGMPTDPEFLSRRIEWVPVLDGRLPKNVAGIVFDREAPLNAKRERMLNRAALRQVPIYETGHFRELLTGRVTLRTHPAEVFGQILPSQPYLRAKRVIDTCAAIPILVLILPVLALVAAAIRIESPGPVIFRQKRIGYQGRVFMCYKFRTMRHGAGGLAYTVDADPRITRVGSLLRKWRIDELPQIANIIKGEMSWIGPRPEALSLARSYQQAIPFYAYRHTVRPGISGWAAVHQGNVALVDAAQRKLEFDFYYIRYFSFWLDFLISLMTIRTIILGFGAK